MVKKRKNSKQLKGGKSNAVIQGGDTISELPDSLLHHILSFLPIKCAVCTSILSKRWRYVWTTTPNLDFLHWRSPTTRGVDIHLETKRFMNFVDRMLFMREGTLNIQKFALKCDEHCDESRINAWISTVIRHNVEDLNLNIKLKQPFFIPLSLFTCGSLIELRLQIYSDLHLPKSISFPRLKILRLFNIVFKDQYLMERLFRKCPVLEELLLSNCTWLKMKTVCISAPALKCLFIDGPNTANLDGLQNCKVKIVAPRLVFLTYKGSVAKEYFLSSFSSLVDVKITFVIEENPDETRREEIGYSVTMLLGRLSDVKSLIVSGEALEALSYANDDLIELPTFQNLIHLGVSSEFPYSASKALFNLLQNAPYMESLVFDKGFPPYLLKADDGWILDMVSRYLFLHLKSVQFKEFYGRQSEIDLAKLFLKKAISLQKLTIKSLFLSEILSMKVEVMEQLLRVSRSSTSCEIELS